MRTEIPALQTPPAFRSSSYSASVATSTTVDLGFEAIGPTDNLRGMIELAAELVFDQALAERVELTLDNAGSYTSWLRQQRDAH
jgi:hypothetical protein